MAQNESDVSVSDDARYPKGPPSLFLKSYIILFLTGSPAFNTVMISPAEVMYLVRIQPCMHKLFLYLVRMLQDVTVA